MPRTADIQDLLAHADWLRRLVRQLLHDDRDAAADVVQQTWMAALRAAPDAERPARPWLAEVARNFVRRRYRDERGRRTREVANAAMANPTAASPEALLEAAELQRTLAELVIALEEPFRATILLRYHQGLEPTEIARNLGVPAGTVRWRVGEAVRRLRQALDARERHAPRGLECRRALLPLAGPPGLPAAPGPPFGSSGVAAVSAAKTVTNVKTGAVIAMGTNTKLVIGSVVTALLVAIGVRTWQAHEGGATATAAGGTYGHEPEGDEDRANSGDRRARAAPASGEPASVAPGGAADARASATSRLARRGGGHASRAVPNFVPYPGPQGEVASAPPAERLGSLDKDQIRRGVRRMIPALKECYSKLLETDPAASGRLVLRFTIRDVEGEGRISEATVVPQSPDAGARELLSPAAEHCIVNALADATFPAVGGKVDVTYPFAFAPNDLIPGTATPAPAPTAATSPPTSRR